MAETIEICEFPITRPQQEFCSSNARVRGFVGGRGAGKTKIGALDGICRALPGRHYMVISPTYVVMHDTTWPTFEETARECGCWITGKESPTPRAKIRTQQGGVAEFIFRTGEKPKSLRGPNRSGLWFDEASLLVREAFVIAMATLREGGDSGWATLTFTPNGKRHWTYGEFYEEVEGEAILKDNRFLVQADTRTNPFLPESFYEENAGLYDSGLREQELGGQFVDLQGLLFRREWFGATIGELQVPRIAHRVRYWDKAAGYGQGDWTAGVLMARDLDGMFYVEDVQHYQVGPLERNRSIVATAERDAAKYGNEVAVVVEQEPGSGGKESAQISIRELAKFPAYRDLVRGKRERREDSQKLPGEAKIVRARPFAAAAEGGNVKLVRGAWNSGWLEELAAFPLYAHDDQVDATSGAFNSIHKIFGRLGAEPPKRDSAPPAEPERFGVKHTAPEAKERDDKGRTVDTRFNRPGWFRRV